MNGHLRRTGSTKRHFLIGVVTVAVICLLMGVASSQEGVRIDTASPQVSQPVVQKKEPVILTLSPRIESFKEKIMAADTLDDVRKSFMKQTFTRQELEQLDNMMQRQPYKRKLDGLKADAEKSHESVLQKQTDQDALKRIQQQTLRQQQHLSAMNREMEVRLRARERQLDAEGSELAPVGRLKPPRIDSLSSGEITPGQVIGIEGKNFGALEGKVSFLISGRTFKGQVDFWHDESIIVSFPSNVSGLPQVIGKVEVTTTAKMKSAKTIQFMPTLVQRHLSQWRTLASYGILGDGINREFLNNYQLINGWHVTETWLVEETSGRAGAYYKTQPSVGDDSPRAMVRLWVDAFCSVRAVHNVTIEGPKGLTPFTKTN